MTAATDTSPLPAATAPAGPGVARRWAVFVLIAVGLYLALYAAAEILIYQTGQKNRFFMVRTAAAEPAFDFVILGASHAMPFGFDDTNEKLEAATGARIINLSIEGAGILPNRLMLDYFLQRHATRNVVYILDSFGFYSRQWNEDRLVDAGLFKRAPLDPALVATLWRYPWARGILPDYLSGFSKINNSDRFEPDLPDTEVEKFDRTYRPVAQIDRQRIAYLYPPDVSQETISRYMGEFESLIGFLKERGIGLVVVKPPMPPRVREKLTGEAQYDAAIAALLAKHGIPYRDFSGVVNEDQYFYDTDHLNRTGVTTLNDGFFVPMLKEQLAASPQG